jgi:hypothetical protein
VDARRVKHARNVVVVEMHLLRRQPLSAKRVAESMSILSTSAPATSKVGAFEVAIVDKPVSPAKVHEVPNPGVTLS